MAKFTRQHYVTVAQTLAGLQPVREDFNSQAAFRAALQQWGTTVSSFTCLFANDNVNFKRDIFYAACCKEE